MPHKRISIIGGGSSALSAAFFLSSQFDVTIFEKEKNVGQKFLVAGKGGFNLTNSLEGKALVSKYEPKDFLKNALLKFDSNDTRRWLKNIGIETYVGTSGRVFSLKKYKPIEVLEAIKSYMTKKGVKIYTGYKFSGFDSKKNPIINHDQNIMILNSDYYIFALGGSSWPITGSDGKWLKYFDEIGVKIIPFEPSNCGVNISWPNTILDHHVGKPLKNIEVSVAQSKSKGEAVITEYGLEGNAIYSVIPNLRNLLNNGPANLFIDFKPNNNIKELRSKIKTKIGKSQQYREKLNLNTTHIALIKSFVSKDEYTNTELFLNRIKKIKLNVKSLRPVEEAISTVGGIDTNELNGNFSLKKYPNIFTIGEMVNWDAPTGGFLLQACFSMGNYIAESLISQNMFSK